MIHKSIMVFLAVTSFSLMFLSDRPLSYAVVLWALLSAISYFDIRSYRLPNILNVAILLVGIGYNIQIGQEFWLPIISVLIALSVLSLISFLYHRYRGKHGMGFGDIKLFAAGAVWVLPHLLPVILFISSFLALMWTMMMNGLHSFPEKNTKLPFGPHLALSIWIVWLFSDQIVDLLI